MPISSAHFYLRQIFEWTLYLKVAARTISRKTTPLIMCKPCNPEITYTNDPEGLPTK